MSGRLDTWFSEVLIELISDRAEAHLREVERRLEGRVRTKDESNDAQPPVSLEYDRVRRALSDTRIMLREARRLRLKDDNAVIDADHWSAGELGRIEGVLNSYERELKDPGKLSAEDLSDLGDAIKQAQREICTATVAAQDLMYASQYRGEVAEGIANSLTERGFNLVDEGYQGSDMRAAHIMRLNNPGLDMEIGITQTPEIENGRVRNHMEIDILKYPSADKERVDAIVALIAEVLSGLGLETGNISCREGYENRPSDSRAYEDIGGYTGQEPDTIARPESGFNMEEKVCGR
ncbi:MAG: hypothetical protein IKR56_06845 [Lachnospiraceae bacterium]|nr:hypothetical protein [Lachnospiraceae bacterium]